MSAACTSVAAIVPESAPPAPTRLPTTVTELMLLALIMPVLLLALPMMLPPSIVGVLDSGVDGDQMYVAMELLVGEELAARIDRGPMPLAEFERGELTIGVSGGPCSGYIYELLQDPEMTHDAYHAELRKYLDARTERIATEPAIPTGDATELSDEAWQEAGG